MRKYVLLLPFLVLINSHASSDHHHNHDDHHREHKHEHKKASLGAHVHGELECSIAVDENEVYLELQSPAESLLDFEHRPKTKKEKEKWNELSRSWKNNLLNSFKILGQECEVQEPTIVLNVDDEGSHAHIHAQAQLNCPKKLNAQRLQVDLRERFKAIKKLNIQVLPAVEAPYQKSLEGSQKSIELKL